MDGFDAFGLALWLGGSLLGVIVLVIPMLIAAATGLFAAVRNVRRRSADSTWTPEASAAR